MFSPSALAALRVPLVVTDDIGCVVTLVMHKSEGHFDTWGFLNSDKCAHQVWLTLSCEAVHRLIQGVWLGGPSERVVSRASAAARWRQGQ